MEKIIIIWPPPIFCTSKAPPPPVSDPDKNIKTRDAYNSLYFHELAKIISPEIKELTGPNSHQIDKLKLPDGSELTLVGFHHAFEDAVSKVIQKFKEENAVDEVDFIWYLNKQNLRQIWFLRVKALWGVFEFFVVKTPSDFFVHLHVL